MSKRKATQPKARHPTGHINQRGDMLNTGYSGGGASFEKQALRGY